MKVNIIIYLFFTTLQRFYSEKTSTCPILSKTNAQIQRQLHGAGFHRHLETSVTVSTPFDLNSCYVLVKEVFPPGAYSDPNELKFLNEFNGPSYFIPQFVNVETPQHLSPKIQAYFFAQPIYEGASRWHMNISVPVHIRYHRAKQGSHHSLEEKVIFSHPSIFLLCDNELSEECLSVAQLEPCPPTGVQQCDWIQVHTFSTSDWVDATVPIGNVELVETVLLTTTTVTFGATLLLLVSLFKNTRDPYLYHKTIT